MSDTLYFQDFLMESGLDQCHWCGKVDEPKEMRWVSVDKPGNSQQVCVECLQAYYWKHSA